MKKYISIAVSIFISLNTAAFILSLGIAVPILIRPFYYAQIGPLKLEQDTGFDRRQIIDAYDEMLDYCVGASDTFGTGTLRWSLSGKAHFDDVRRLFILDLRILAATAIVLVIAAAARVAAGYAPARLFGHAPRFYSAAALLSFFAIAGAAMALDFDNAFTIFHKIFFPGKDNWILDAKTDQIILILPERFFFNCALLIIGVIAVLCAVCIVSDLAAKRRGKKSAS